MKKTYLAFCAAALSVTLMTSCGNDPNPAKEDAVETAKDQNDAKFDDSRMEDPAEWATKAAAGGMAEVEFSKLAQKNAANPKVREFAGMMVTDHMKANDQLKALATQKNITLPTAMDDAHQTKYNDMSAKTGADFDKAYMDLMVDDHQNTVDLFEDQAKDGKDVEFKNFASTTLPNLQHHLEMAKQTKDLVK
jgi:putative membrane protein